MRDPRVRSILGPTVPEEVDEEIAFHLAMRARELVEQGMGEDEAREEALRRFGDPAAMRAECGRLGAERERGRRRRDLFEEARQDLAHALRSLARQPGFALLAVLTLALGIGANSALLGLLDRLFLSPPPHVADAGRVVHLAFEHAMGGERYAMSTTSYATFRDLEGGTDAFEALAAAASGDLVLGSGAEAAAIRGAKVSGRFFELLGARPAHGRFFREPEDRSPAGQAVAVLGHAFWRHRFGADPAAVGREIVLDGEPFEVIGVAPPGFTGDGVERVDAWIPLSAGMRAMPPGWRELRGFNMVTLVGRLRGRASVAATEEEATAAYRRGLAAHGPAGAADEVAAVRLRPLVAASTSEGLTPSGRIALWVGGVTAAVFLLAVVNFTNLQLLRAARRQREVAVRVALGMTGRRLASLWAAESLLLAAAGGAAALLVARWGGESARVLLAPEMAPAEGFVTPRILVATALAAAFAGLVAGLLPARVAASGSLRPRLESGPSPGGSGRPRLLGTLLFVQTATSAVLLAGAGLFLASLYHVRTQNLGFTTERTLYAQIPPQAGGAASERDAFYRRALAEVRELPGVEMAIPVDALPFGPHVIPPISVPGLAEAPGAGQQLPFLNGAVPEYFRMMGMRVLRGRGFTAADDARGPLVVVVSETMARTIWPGEDALGKCIRVGFAEGEEPTMQASPSLPCREVVGIVNDARRRSIRPEDIPIMQYYVPFEQAPKPPVPGIPAISGLLVRTAGEAEEMVAAVRRSMQSAAAGAPYVDVRPYQALLEPQVRPWVLGSALFAAGGALALAMAAVGIYGMLAYGVAQRTREIGIRTALGARRRDVLLEVLREGLATALVGLLAGAAVVIGAGRWVEPLLFGVTSGDPGVLAAVTLALALAALAAALVPALRAGRVEPLVALRRE